MNAAGWIRRCAESCHVLQGDFQFIFVNDFSTDQGEDILEKISDSRFRLVENYHSVGVSGARNTGLDFASGGWVTFLDADDEFLPQAADVFERMIRLDPTANIIQANHLRKYDMSGRIVNKYGNKAGRYLIGNLPACWCMVWNKLYRRSFIDGLRFDTHLRFGEDELFNMECLARDGRIFHTKMNTVTVLRHFDNKKSLSHIKEKEDLLKEARAIEDFIIRQEDAAVRQMAYDRLIWHWQSVTYRRIFGVAVCDI